MFDIINNVKIAVQCGFDVIAETVRTHNPIEIVQSCANLFGVPPEKMATYPMGGYSKKRRSGAFYFALKDLKEHIEAYEWLYENLCDNTSRNVFSLLMLYRICPDKSFIKSAYDGKNPQYFDKSIVKTDENEVFVDCGGYSGDSALSYIENCGAYKRIYVYEPLSDNVKKCNETLRGRENIIIRELGVGKNNEVVVFSGEETLGFIDVDGKAVGETRVNIVTLDTDISEPVTFIKMDIEGAEIDAINGARRHISEDKPKLAICLYHLISDIWEIPQLIHSINPNYDYYIRHYYETQPWETVQYAIPK